MNAHTPGPWEAKAFGKYAEWGVLADSQRVKVAGYIGGVLGADEANARLIALSPELLALAKDVRDALEVRYDGAPDSSTKWMGVLLARIDEVLARGGK